MTKEITIELDDVEAYRLEMLAKPSGFSVGDYLGLEIKGEINASAKQVNDSLSEGLLGTKQ